MLKTFSTPSIIKKTSFDWFLAIVCTLYLYFMSEYLTIYIKLFFLTCLILNGLNIRLNLLGKILVILIICSHHGVFYGLKITAESAINFILGMCGLKILEQNTYRDRHLLIFIIFLLLNSSLLFEKSIFILTYVIISYFGIIILITKSKWNWQYLVSALKSLVFVIPLIIVSYTFFPRWNSQIFGNINIAGTSTQSHKIGLSLDVNFKDLQSVTPNSSVSFLSFMGPTQKPLYWRSHTLSETDGWNWQRNTSDSLFFRKNDYDDYNLDLKNAINQKIQLENNQQYFITLDRPIKIIHDENSINIDSYSLSSLFPARSIKKSYAAQSLASPFLFSKQLSHGDRSNLLKLPNIKKEVLPKIPYKSRFDLLIQLQNHFREMNFTYSYMPGLVENLSVFLETKKGFCSHFASYVALILRSNQIPARLVSGYLGGQYNADGSYYRVIENDAHVWVEAFLDSEWTRIDPTLWLASIRQEGGNAALFSHYSGLDTYSSISFFVEKKFPDLFQSLSRLNSFSEQLNSKFQFWLENFNLTKQREIAKKWQLTLNEFFLVGILSAIISIALMTSWILWSLNKRNNNSWSHFVKLNQRIFKFYPELAPHWGKISYLENFLKEQNTSKAKKVLTQISKFKKKYFQ